LTAACRALPMLVHRTVAFFLFFLPLVYLGNSRPRSAALGAQYVQQTVAAVLLELI
jgi:hypothetical protein